MTSRELLDEILAQGPPSDALRLECRLIFRTLADNLHAVELRSGARLSDTSDVIQLFREMVDELNPGRARSRPPGYNIDFCPDCGHVHVDDNECSFPTGGNRTCRCERKVSA